MGVGFLMVEEQKQFAKRTEKEDRKDWDPEKELNYDSGTNAYLRKIRDLGLKKPVNKLVKRCHGMIPYRASSSAAAILMIMEMEMEKVCHCSFLLVLKNLIVKAFKPSWLLVFSF